MSDTAPADLAPGATRELARFSAALTFESLPAPVVAHLKLAILDGLGCIVHGATLPWTARVAALVASDAGKPEATAFGLTTKVPATAAALVNATAGHAFELDDIHRDSIIHPNSLTLAAALALAERAGGLNGKSFLTAIAAGYEVGARIGAAAGPGLLLGGFHPQGTTGAFASAATAAHVLGLDAERTLHALGIAGSLGAGLMAAQEGAMVKRLHSGNAAQAGVRGVLLAETGFTGIDNVIEAGYGGFITAHSTTPAPNRLLDGLGPKWEILATGFKPHSTVTSIHACLDALSAIRREQAIDAGAIERIEAFVSTPTHVHCAWPYRAQSVTAAQMNIYYGLAVMALDGEAFVDQFTEARIAEPRTLEMTRRIEAHVDPEIDALGPSHRHTARVRVTTTDGKTFEKRVEMRKGSPENPLTAVDVETKFRALTKGTLSSNAADKATGQIAALESMPDVRGLITLLVGGA
jgi:2-methylcitrate dehydratase PrpD